MTAPIIDHRAIDTFAKERVNLPKAEVDQYRGQVQRLRDKLKRLVDEHETYSLIKTLHSGSVAKGTALKSVSDMDVAAYLDASLVDERDESKVIHEVATILRAAYGNTKSAEDFEEQMHSVKVHFHGTDLDIDVVPITYSGGDDDRGDLITSYGDRVETSITLHLQFIRNRKSQYGPNYAQVIRLLKYWVRHQKSVRGTSFRCKSFLIELIVAHLADNGTDLSDYPKALEAVFAWVVQTRLEQVVWFSDYHEEPDIGTFNDPIRVIDPVNPLNNVCVSYTATDQHLLLEAAADALDAVTAAHPAPTKGQAVTYWQEIFGPTFRGTS